MAETLRELVVALSLDSSNFSRNMRSINQQIKESADQGSRVHLPFGWCRCGELREDCCWD